MRKRRKPVAALIALVALAASIGIAAPPAAGNEPKFEWLCKPGQANDPCQGDAGSLETLTVTAGGPAGSSTPNTLPRLRNNIDCFYVYPTVSGQAGPNADLSRDPEIPGIALQQAARFAPGCRMFAPIYRQYTVTAILASLITEEAAAIAYGSVKAAWDEYITQHNKGRGIVLIGHSQGTGHLKQLIAETFDRRLNLRKRLVSAVLIGGNVIVAKGKRTGGNFTAIPSCSRAGQLGCVIAYSGFLKDAPPEDALFGRLGGALVESGFDPATHEIMCVNPARLEGSKGALKPLYNTEPFPGIYGPLLPDLTAFAQPWVSFPNLYTADCRRTGTASWLAVDELTGGEDMRPRIGEPLGRTWGTHLTEVNDAAGNLVSVVLGQERAYVRKLAQARRAKARQKARMRARQKARQRARQRARQKARQRARQNARQKNRR